MKRTPGSSGADERAAKRWALDQESNLVEHARGPLVLHQDYGRLRIAHERVKDKLRQVSVLYQTLLAQRERWEQMRSRCPPEIVAELSALRKLARVVAQRAGNHPELQQALHECLRAREKSG
jgi:hypothetical protein